MTAPGLIEMNEIIARLLDLPGELAIAEDTLMRLDQDRRHAAHCLEDATDRLLLDGAIDGKNAELRTAQLRQALLAEQADLDMAERLVAGAKIQLHRLQNEHASLRAIARLIAAQGED